MSLSPEQEAAMERMAAEETAQRQQRDAVAAAFIPKMKTNGLPEVQLWIKGRATNANCFRSDVDDYEANGMFHIYAVDSAGEVGSDVGLIILEPAQDNVLGLCKILSYYFNAGRRYGTSALQELTRLARSAGYKQITGEMSPEGPEDEEKLRKFYRREGYILELAPGQGIRLKL